MSSVGKIIEQEIEVISRFIALLNEEQEILKQGNVDALTGLNTRKEPLVDALNALESERQKSISTSDNPPDPDAMKEWLATHGDGDLTVNWKKLLNFARDAKSLHEINARLVDMHLRQTSEILAILTQQPEKEGLYGSSGQTLPATGSRIVDSA